MGGSCRQELRSKHLKDLDLKSWDTPQTELSCLIQEQEVYVAV